MESTTLLGVPTTKVQINLWESITGQNTSHKLLDKKWKKKRGSELMELRP